MSTNGAGVTVSAADVGWDTALRRWSAKRPPKDPMDDVARVRAGAGSREPNFAMMPAQSGRTTPKIERVRAFFRRDLHQLILGWPGPILQIRGGTLSLGCLPGTQACTPFQACPEIEGEVYAANLECNTKGFPRPTFRG